MIAFRRSHHILARTASHSYAELRSIWRGADAGLAELEEVSRGAKMAAREDTR